jgi:hypothetical protein
MAKHSSSFRLAALAGSLVAVAALAGCDDTPDFDISEQIGPNPVLPEPNQPLVANV